MLDNDNPDHRAELVKRLNAKGLPAFEWESGGGIVHVVVPLLQEGETRYEINAESTELISDLQKALKHNPYNPHLYIATNSLQTSCEIGLMGEDAYGNFVSSKNWDRVIEFEAAEKSFYSLWKNRDNWLRKWVSGELDT